MKISVLGLATITAGVLLCVAAVVASDRALRHDNANAASGTGQVTMSGMDMSGTSASSIKGQSFAGAAPANAKELAAAHTPYPALLPPVPAGKVAKVHMVLKDVTVEIAPGVKYAAWGFQGGVPGPIVHVRQGQTVEMTLTNGGAIPHSIDFHAARIAPNLAFVDVMPGTSFTFRFTANDPGVFMYHCGTKPVLMHIANGMYGAIVVDPKIPLPHADRSYVLVASEWYLTSDGLSAPAQFDLTKARAVMPDWTTFNGYAGQYVAHPLTADPGDTVRFYVVDAGPSLTTAFHVVGTILNTAYVDGDTSAAQALHGVQTVDVPAGGGGIFDVKIDQEGLYPFVSHSFASVDMGQVGLLKIGNPKGTASH
jgi:nitrite reductase (NO-forming)